MKMILATCLIVAACADEQNLGNAARDPVPYTTLAVGPADAYDMAIDDTYVYWLVDHQNPALGGATLFRVPKQGGAMETVSHVSSQGWVWQFVIDDAYAYAVLTEEQEIVRIPKVGGTPEVIDVAPLDSYSVVLGVDDTWLYTKQSTGATAAPPWGADHVSRRPKAGGPPQLILDVPEVVERVVFGPASLYFAESREGELWTAPSDGGVATPITEAPLALPAAIDTDNLYLFAGQDNWSNTPYGPGESLPPPQCWGGIVAVPLAGGAPRDLGSTPTCMVDLAISADAAYSAETAIGTPPPDGPNNAIVRFPFDGSGRQELVTGLASPMAIAAEPDGSALYWIDYVTGEVNRLQLADQF